MSSLEVEEVLFTTADGSIVGGLNVETIDITNITVDNLTVNTSIGGTALPGGVVSPNGVQTLTNKTIIGGSSGNNISANSIQGVTISTTAPTNVQILTYNSGTSSWTPTSSSGVTSVSAGTGISITGTATSPIINIANTTVTAATYSAANITFNARGQATAASNIITTKGDLITKSTGGSITRLAVGNDGYALTAFNTSTNGLSYTPPVTGWLQGVGLQFFIDIGGAAAIGFIQADGVTGIDSEHPGFAVVRSPSLGTGGSSVLTTFSAQGIALVPGTTLGTTNNDNRYIYCYGAYNSGNLVMAVSLTPQNTNTLVNTTQLQGAVDPNNASLLYTNLVALTGVPITYIGKIKAPQATAGTWITPATEILIANGVGLDGNQIVTNRGDLITADSNLVPTRLALGGANTFLTSNGSDPTYSALNVGTGLTGNGVSSALSFANVLSQNALSVLFSVTVNTGTIGAEVPLTYVTPDAVFGHGTSTITGWDKTTGIFTCPNNKPGMYLFTLNVFWAANATGQRFIKATYTFSGQGHIFGDERNASSASNTIQSHAQLLYMSNGDTAAFAVGQNSGSQVIVSPSLSIVYLGQ